MEKFYLLYKKYFFWLLLGLAVFIPLYPKFPLLNVAGTYVAVRAEDVLIALAFLIWFLGSFKKIKQLKKKTIYQAILLFWAIGFLSLISGYFITHTISPHLGFLHWLRRIEYMSLFVMAATTIKSTQQLKLILKAGLLVTIVVIFYGFGQQWLNFPVISTTNREFSKGLILFLSPEARVNSTFAGHYDLAIYLSIFLTILASIFFYYKKLWVRTFLTFWGMLGFVLLGMTAARVSFAATFLGLMISFWINKQRLLIIGLVLLSVATVAVVPELRHRLVATLTVNFLGGGGPKYTPPENMSKDPGKRLSLDERQKIFDEATKSGVTDIATISSDIAPGEPINPTELGVHRSFGIRLDVEWPRALRGFLRNPMLGTGYSSLAIATDNDLLRSLGEVGLLGTLALLLIFLILIKRVLIFIKKDHDEFEKKFIIGVFCSMLAIFLTGLFIDVFEASKVATLIWFVLGVSWAVLNNYQDSE